MACVGALVICPVCGSPDFYDVFGADCPNTSCSNFRGTHAYNSAYVKKKARTRGAHHPPAPRDFVDAYIEAALWSTNDESTPSGGEPLDKNYDASDIDAETMRQIELDCAEFYNANAQFWEGVDGSSDPDDDQSGMTDESAGHNFWLTREGHGTGFWDRDSLSDKSKDLLTDAARSFGEFYLNVYEDDDGREHIGGSPLSDEARNP